MTRSFRPPQNGFTLIEVLVALVVSAFLLTILFDGLVASQERARNQSQAQAALILAHGLLEGRRDGGAVMPNLSGTSDGLIWRLEEEEIARDPRQVFALVGVKAQVGTKKSPRLIKLQRRFLRAVQ